MSTLIITEDPTRKRRSSSFLELRVDDEFGYRYNQGEIIQVEFQDAKQNREVLGEYEIVFNKRIRYLNLWDYHCYLHNGKDKAAYREEIYQKVKNKNGDLEQVPITLIVIKKIEEEEIKQLNLFQEEE